MSESINGSEPLKEKEEQTFEAAMEELEEIVEKLETGEVPLEEAIQLFQKGMKLSQNCHEKLQNVERQVNLLIEEEGQTIKQEFRLEEDPREG